MGEAKDSRALLETFFHHIEAAGASTISWFHRCLLWHTSPRPLELLLKRGDEIWPPLVATLVRHGGGFPHWESAENMAQVGAVLAGHSQLHTFLAACSDGGDPVRPGTPAMAGIFLGLLDPSIAPARASQALHALITAGLEPNSPLAHGGLWPLHAAARKDCIAVIEGLLARRANPFAKNGYGLTPLEVANAAHAKDAVSVLQSAAAKAAGRRWVERARSTDRQQ